MINKAESQSTDFLIFICFSSSLYAVNDYAILSDKTPKALSEYDFFSDPLNQIPNSDVVPYELITALFLTIQIHRFVYLLDGTTAKYEGEKFLIFHRYCTIKISLIKLIRGTLKFETRLLLNKEEGWDVHICLYNDRGDAFSTWRETIEVTDVVRPTNANFIRYSTE